MIVELYRGQIPRSWTYTSENLNLDGHWETIQQSQIVPVPSQQKPALPALTVPICPGPRGKAIPLISGQLMSASRILQKEMKPADIEKQLGRM
jgi:hypothetical protein